MYSEEPKDVYCKPFARDIRFLCCSSHCANTTTNSPWLTRRRHIPLKTFRPDVFPVRFHRGFFSRREMKHLKMFVKLLINVWKLQLSCCSPKQWVKLLGNCVKHLTCTDSSPPQPTYSHDYGSTHFTGEKTEAQSCSVTVLVKVQSRDLTRSCSPVN